jgi:hypothetical protein
VVDDLLYETTEIEVRRNSSGEIFVSPKSAEWRQGGLNWEYGPTIRISPKRRNLVVTSQNAIYTPTSINGLPGFIVSKRGENSE